jgi:hypothetical protein
MTSGELREAKAVHYAMREGTYWQAAAVNASYLDADAVVRAWRAGLQTDRWAVSADLRAALDALADRTRPGRHSSVRAHASIALRAR